MSSSPPPARQEKNDALEPIITQALAGPQHGLTPELADELCAAAEDLPDPLQAALACGVAPHTLLWWLRTGVAPNAPEPFLTFARRFFSADARALRKNTKAVEKALDEGEAAVAMARLAYTKWRHGDKPAATHGDLLHRALRESK